MNTTWFCRLTLILAVMAGLAWRASATVFTTNTSIGPSNTNYDGQDIVISNCTVTVDGVHAFSSLVVATNGILTHSFSTNGELNGDVQVGLYLTATNTVLVASGGAIDADGVGYGGGFGAGAGSSSGGTYFDGSGGGDGGNGGLSLGNAINGTCYDSLYQPGLPGSGGGASYAGNGGNGGGLIQITTSGNIEIDGAITANGQSATNSRAGGGSGGGIWISAHSVSGVGSIAANGGSGAPGYGGGGGGGRVAISCAFFNGFTGSIAAYGGNGATNTWNNGGAGTIFTQVYAQTGMLTMDNGGKFGNGSTVALPAAVNVTVSDGAALDASGYLNISNVVIGTNGILELSSSVFQNIASLTIESGGLLSGYPSYANTSDANSYTTGGITYGGGGGYGGNGGAAAVTNAVGGGYYGYETTPASAGSSGAGGNTSVGGPGGGLVEVNVSGTALVNGTISANGGNGLGIAGGGGSGGSIYLEAGTLSGNGSITANGGAGTSLGGGGGGGRIAIYVQQSNTFTGAVTAYGGGGANYGGAGTIIVPSGPGGPPQALLLVDNGGNVGPPTVVTSDNTLNLVIQNGARASIPNASVNSLTIASNSWLSGGPYNYATSLTVISNATIQAGGGIIVDSDGYPANTSDTGAAGYSTIPPYGGGGGGNGGYGAPSVFNSPASGGLAGYNTISSPSISGGGGGGIPGYSLGGSGGGVFGLHVNGTLLDNGAISANGGNGSGSGGGGGAGGSLNISAGFLSGTGSITANGGNGANGIGGGGGGGCIAFAFNTNLFIGTLSAFGGGGANIGGAGTIYFKTNSAMNGQIIVDNGGQNGVGSAASSSSATTDLTLRNNGLLFASSSLSVTYGNVLITNASIVVTNGLLTMTANNVNVQNGGGIIANAAGYVGNSGPFVGRFSSVLPYYPGGGGGNGGCGGASITNGALGGGGYGNYNLATEAGSGGGGSGPYSFGGAGGGIIQLNISGTLTVNGTVSANGGNGSGNGGGGGAGGSLALTVRGLTGSGLITANGGNGANGIGGGGGGGVIDVNFNSPGSNVFAGVISAYGGHGGTNGGAGTVLIKTNGLNTGVLIVDNGGNVGTNTPISNEGSTFNLQVRNGAMLAPVPGSSFRNVLVTSNAWIVPVSSGQVELTVSSVATINFGGGIIADAFGGAQNTGPTPGRSFGVPPYYQCSGAGHGGWGGFSLSNSVSGGGANDNIQDPFNIGSGGGGFIPYSPGGQGGGYIELGFQPGGILQLNGTISANGGAGSGIGGGGGSGGGIYINGGLVTGTGSITANGGNGAAAGGGGGGGLISLIYTGLIYTNPFAGTISARGGGGANYGGAGTIYMVTNSSTPPLLLLDNGGNVGTNTPLGQLGVNVTVQNGAIGVIPSSSWNPDNVLVRSNGALTVQSFPGFSFNMNAQSLTIATGGALNLDGCGYSQAGGPGAGAYSGGVAGGGGHGGYGGDNSNVGGGAYDTIQFPTQAGSSGAFSSTPANAGAGGGNIVIQVASNLVVNGRISANGFSGGLNSGGGAGGSIYLENIPNFSGTGVISANGGASLGSGGGGGGGGRIAVACTSNSFTGQISASGGAGGVPGGAGTIYSKVGNVQTLVVNNGGIFGTNTPLSSAFTLPLSPFELDISGGASVVALTPLPLLSNLNVSAVSTLTMPVALSNLFIGVMGNANIGGNLDVDGLGYLQATGPGAGVATYNEGSGAGYGGVGGASGSGASGGVTYGSATAPTDFGSGGGNGAATTSGGSTGGGALRLSVLGTLTVNGNISANGDSGLQDDSGGGSGGSVWISAGMLSGSGTISAAGGSGVLYGGGGGGGGRIAIYAPTNHFTGTTNVNGGMGSTSGQSGTLSLSSALNGMQVVLQSPNGYVSNTVSSVLLTFSDMLNPSSVSSSDFQMYGPAGTLNPGPGATIVSPFSVQLTFPTQNVPGPYTIQIVGSINDLAGAGLAPYTGVFIITIPTISGTVTGTNGAGVAGVAMQPSGGLPASYTGSDGSYYVGVPPGWTGTVTPSAGSDVFVPASISYTNISASLTNQNYTMVSTISPSLTTSYSAGNFSLNWNGYSGVNYQVLWSTNLVTWQPLGSPLAGTNGPMQIVLPTGSNSTEFFQIQAGE